MSLSISVIIPVYNAEPFLRKAVESALQFKEVKEVILVEDKSPDNALLICEQLVSEDNRVQLLQHPNNENLGAGESRNLGLKHAKQEYIAFLDADDIYLPNRFEKEKELFKNLDVDGVYNAIGVHYYSEEAKVKFCNTFNHPYNLSENFLTTVNREINPKELFEALVRPKNSEGYFSLDGLTIRKSSLKKLKGGWFNDELRLHQDTEFIARLSFYLDLYTGEITKATALRGVHESNRITNNIDEKERNLFLKHNAIGCWAKSEESMDNDIQHYLINQKLYHETFQNKGFKLISTFIKNSFFSKGYVAKRKFKELLFPIYNKFR
ncbi:glycosyltransferase family 2 protein [Brumimicrobium aurantiacum]|uniref:Glycosyltransferase n=1 Tax=Brumimicrobium aurantiacum TaxID=1737063 RepID=A0A3E1F1W6_9FLAO|nr:glycosyltransferase [Brumimicrobium aurantiacum]RFC55743.1 glycosyltransferase [Brumimicrobium aurantiacum]